MQGRARLRERREGAKSAALPALTQPGSPQQTPGAEAAPVLLAFLSRSPSGREKTGRRGGLFGAIRSSRTFRGPIEKRDDAAAGDGDSRRRLTSRRPDLR